ncbi:MULTISPECIES: peptidoglycan DD-metalloendopeptidase family protein [unclassified Knoellia]|uniref:peptidoglycan DD-metalloendopeptidase family protein n=1 Tax=Knoellia altitudinis TaxID=3404795 RepID=UPI00362293F2
MTGGFVAAALALLGSVATLPAASAAGPRPVFQVPFPCGETWRMTTYEGHGGGDLDFNLASGAEDLGKPVVAAAAGRVFYSGVLDPGGNHIEIDHGNGWKTVYAHLNTRSVAAGAQVAQGQVIGTVGNTGTSTGPHLHFETRADGVSQQVYFNGVYAGVSDLSNQYGPVSITSQNCAGGSGTSSPASGDVFAFHRNDQSKTSVHGMDNRTNFQSFWIQTLAGIHSTIDPARFEHRVADFNADGTADLYVFDRADAGQIAVHVLDGRSHFQSFVAHRRMQLPGISRFKLDVADYNGDGRAEVYAFDTNDNGRTAVHVLDAATHFGTFLMQTRSALAETTSAVWSFAAADFNGDRRADVYAFHGSDTGRTAVHVLDAASNFQTFSIHTRTALPALSGTKWTLDAGDYDVDGRADIYAIDPADGDRTAVHVLSPTTNFQSFTVQTRTALPVTTDPIWSTSVVP